MSLLNKLPGMQSGMGLAVKFGFITGITLITLLAVSASITLQQQQESLNGLLISSEEILNKISAEQITEDSKSESIKVKQLIKLLAQIAPGAIAELDLTGLLNYASVAVEDPDISYVAFYDKENHQLTVSGERSKVADNSLLTHQIMFEGELFGKVELGFNHLRSEAKLKHIEQQNTESLLKMQASKEASYNKILISQITLSLIAALIAAFTAFIVAKTLTQPLKTAIAVANKIASGDLTAKITVKSQDETGKLLIAMKTMLEKLQQMVSHINGATTELETTVQQMSSVSDSTTQSSIVQQQETGMLATAMTEMTSSVQEVANNANEASDSVQSATQEAGKGKQVVQDNIKVINLLANQVSSASTVIQELQTQSNTIGSVLDVIRGIAEQTNLLALNAAIEAARAGEQGRGFAVVADEVRTLASRTQDATQEIQDMIEKLQVGSENAVQVMSQCQEQAGTAVKQTSEAGATLESINDVIGVISKMNIEIACAAKEQGNASNEIEKNIHNISQASENTVDNTHILESANNDLRAISSTLSDLIRQFKTG